MASTYSALKIELLETGANSGTWGTATNVNLGDAVLGEAITGQATVDFATDADVTITLTDSATTQAARNLRLNITESSTGIGSVRNLILGSGCQIEKFYLINNTGTGAKTVKNTSGTGISVPAGKATLVYNNGTNVVDAASYFTSLTLGSALPVASGGTGLTAGTSGGVLAYTASGTLASSGALAQYGVVLGGGAGAVPTSTAVGTATHVLTSNGSGVAPTFQALPAGGVTTFTAGTTGFTPNTATSGAVTLAGTLNVANGGTGLTTLTANRVPYGNGTSAFQSSANLTFDGTTLTGSNISTTTFLTAQRTNATTTAQLAIADFTAISTGDMVDGFGAQLRYFIKDTAGVDNLIATTSAIRDGADTAGALVFNVGTSGATEGMRLNAAGNLGLGVTPSAWNSSFRVMQLGNSGFIFGRASQTQMEMGNNAVFDATDTRWEYITTNTAQRYIQDGTSGAHQWFNAASGTAGNAISFTQAMTLEGTDRTNLLVGTTSSLSGQAGRTDLSVNGSSTAIVSLGVAGARQGYFYTPSVGAILAAENGTLSLTTTSSQAIIFNTNNAQKAIISAAGGFSVGTSADPGAGAIYATGNITAYYSSDIKFKENVRDIPDALATVNAIGGKLFDWKDDYIDSKGGADGYFVQKADFGVVAQDVQKVFPIAVRTREDGSLAVDYEKLGALAFAAVGELTALVQTLATRVEALEAK
jgi:hypothetical protein